MAQGLRKKKDKSDTRYLEVSDGEGNGDRSVEDGEHRLSQEMDISMGDFLKMMIRQEDQREKRDRRDKEEREARDREWMERMNEQEERRQLRAEQAAKDKELMETARRKEEADRRWEEEECREERLQRDREVLLVEQQEMREANREMHERRSQQHAYDSLLARLPKFSTGMLPTSFLQSLENQLRDGGVQENRWLTALESCLDGPAQESFFRVVKKCDRADYASAKMQLIRVAGPTLANKLEQVTVFRWPKDGSKTTLWGDCIEHVASFLVGGESGEEVAFKWALSRTLAHCKRDCAEAVWKASPSQRLKRLK